MADMRSKGERYEKLKKAIDDAMRVTNNCQSRLLEYAKAIQPKDDEERLIQTLLCVKASADINLEENLGKLHVSSANIAENNLFGKSSLTYEEGEVVKTMLTTYRYLRNALKDRLRRFQAEIQAQRMSTPRQGERLSRTDVDTVLRFLLTEETELTPPILDTLKRIYLNRSQEAPAPESEPWDAMFLREAEQWAFGAPRAAAEGQGEATGGQAKGADQGAAVPTFPPPTDSTQLPFHPTTFPRRTDVELRIPACQGLTTVTKEYEVVLPQCIHAPFDPSETPVDSKFYHFRDFMLIAMSALMNTGKGGHIICELKKTEYTNNMHPDPAILDSMMKIFEMMMIDNLQPVPLPFLYKTYIHRLLEVVMRAEAIRGHHARYLPGGGRLFHLEVFPCKLKKPIVYNRRHEAIIYYVKNNRIAWMSQPDFEQSQQRPAELQAIGREKSLQTPLPEMQKMFEKASTLLKDLQKLKAEKETAELAGHELVARLFPMHQTLTQIKLDFAVSENGRA